MARTRECPAPCVGIHDRTGDRDVYHDEQDRAGDQDRVRMTELVRREPAPDPGRSGSVV